MSDLLILGASGTVGSALRAAIEARGEEALYASRSAHPVADAASASAANPWFFLDLEHDALPATDALLSAGPLDHFVAALERSTACRLRTIVALSSSSVIFKRASSDPQEAALAARLQDSETRLEACAEQLGARCVILRPTLIHGGNDTASLGAIASASRRMPLALLPRTARGLRMPVHAREVAQCMLAALANPQARGVFAMGGGETLHYDDMVRRVLRARGIRTPVLRVPDAMFNAALGLAQRCGRLRSLTPAMVMRMREDLVVDDSEARSVLDHAPEPFVPRRTP